MIYLQIDQVPVLVAGATLLLTLLKWVSLHIGLRTAIRATPAADRWRLYGEFARAHHAGVNAPVLALKISHNRRESGARGLAPKGPCHFPITPTDAQQDF